MIDAYRRTKDFLWLHGIFLCVGILVILLSEKEQLHLTINQWHASFFDIFFKYATHMAEEYVIGFLVFIGLTQKVRYGIAGLVGIVSAGLITQLLKRLVFSDMVRPARVFEGIADLHLIDGVILHKAHSFPSGHATAAFALFFFMAFLSNNRWIEFLCFLLALLTAWSRVYLSQHFFEDILVGSVVGTSICFLSLWLVGRQRWGDWGLIDYVDSKRRRG